MAVVTDRQASFIESLWIQAGRDGEAEVPEDRQEASDLIKELLAEKSVAVRVPVQRGVVPVGCYAVEWRDVLRFYRYVEGKGQWAGRTFLNRYKSDEEVRIGRQEYAEVMNLIRSDVEGCRDRFVKETTRCYVCGHRLTDGLSRNLGIGPDCRARRGITV